MAGERSTMRRNRSSLSRSARSARGVASLDQQGDDRRGLKSDDDQKSAGDEAHEWFRANGQLADFYCLGAQFGFGSGRMRSVGGNWTKVPYPSPLGDKLDGRTWP